MARIELEQISHYYQLDTPVLNTIDYTFEDGKAYALLGPSGSGKTTLLNILSGLIHPNQGRILFDGLVQNNQTPRQRNIAQVFQFPVIYDTMSVFENLAFPLKNRGMAQHHYQEKVALIAKHLELEPLLNQKANTLSADVKQKISMGRGLVRDDVSAILFDEPLTMVDADIKWQIRKLLKQLHHQFNHTMIYVTHDQQEALTFSDEVLVMNDGRILQSADPNQLIEYPAHTFIGHFIGNPGMNFLPCTMVNGKVSLINNHQPIPIIVPSSLTERAKHISDPQWTLGIRPEHIQLTLPKSSEQGDAIIQRIDELGAYRIAVLDYHGHTLLAKTQGQHRIGEKINIHYHKHYTHLYQSNGYRIP